jgi:UDPglucose 6-dehydrogenase/GDP-mannose 6-dehydrogenase
MQVAIIGTGYVGLVSGTCLAYKGHKVICVDKQRDVVEKIAQGVSPIHEKRLDEKIKKVIHNKNLSITTDLSEALYSADVAIIAVGTPFKDGAIDLKYIKQVSKEIGLYLKNSDNYIVVTVKSTVVPTTTDSIVLPILERSSGKKCGKDFGLCMNPEFLREGNAVEDFMNPDRIVIGSFDEKSSSVLQRLYADFDAPVITTSLRTAEMIKYTANSLLATLISFSNEMANISAVVGGIDIKEVMHGVHVDHRLNPVVNGKKINPGILTYLEAGCGFGGSCLPKDINALISFAKEYETKTPILEAVISTNNEQPLRLIELLRSIYPKLDGIKLAILGLAFKPNTDDTRESPAIPIVNTLLRSGATISVYDPVVGEEFTSNIAAGKITYAKSWEDALSEADAGILITMWPQFKDITQDKLIELMRRPIIIDGRRMLNRMKFNRNSYFGIGYRPDNLIKDNNSC